MRTETEIPTEQGTEAAASWRRLCGVLLLSLLVVCALNAAAGWFLASHTTNLGEVLLRRKWSLLQNPPSPTDWLILGDSSCNQGVRPDVFDPLMNAHSLNLCTTGQMRVVGEVWMLEDYIRRHGAPHGVVVVHVYDIWGRRTDLAGTNPRPDALVTGMASIPLKWGFWQDLTPHLELGISRQWQLFLTRYVPLYSQHATLKQWMMNPWTTRSRADRERIDARGFMRRAANPKGARRDVRGHQKHVASRTPEIAAENSEALRALGELADRHHFPLYLANSPINVKLASYPAFRDFVRDLDQQLSAIAAEHPQMRLVPGRFEFHSAQMDSADHISPTAAKVFTRQLAQAIQALQ